MSVYRSVYQSVCLSMPISLCTCLSICLFFDRLEYVARRWLNCALSGIANDAAIAEDCHSENHLPTQTWSALTYIILIVNMISSAWHHFFASYDQKRSLISAKPGIWKIEIEKFEAHLSPVLWVRLLYQMFLLFGVSIVIEMNNINIIKFSWKWLASFLLWARGGVVVNR